MPRRTFGTYTLAFTELGQRLHSRRTELGLSAAAIARIAWLDWGYVRRLERGQANPTVGTLLTLAQALETDPAELLTGLTLPDPNNPPQQRPDTPRPHRPNR